MRKSLVVAAVLCFTCTIASAQSSLGGQLNEWKLYGGYQYASLDTHSTQDALNLEHLINPAFPLLNYGERQNLNGWDLGGQNDISKWLGGIVDGSGTYGEKEFLMSSSGGVNVSSRTRMSFYTVTGGPQFTLSRGSHLQPFARVLVGGAWIRNSTDVVANGIPLVSAVATNGAGFAYGGGGGSDISFSRHLGIRVAADWLRTSSFDEKQNNIRTTAGLVYHF